MSPGAAARRWVCCADDYAIDAGAVDGIAELLARGRVTATSVLVDSELWRPAARMLPAAGVADVGLHLNFTQAFAGPARDVWSLPTLLARALLRTLPRARLRAGIERQLDAFEDALGRRPDYIDGHQHVHQLPVIREELLAALQRRYRAERPWIRSTRPAARRPDAKARLIGALGDRGLRRAARRAGFPLSAALAGVYGFDADPAAYRALLRGWFAQGPDGTVLMCHPARSSGGADPIGAARRAEFAVFADDAFPQELAAAGITFSTGTRLFAAGGA